MYPRREETCEDEKHTALCNAHFLNSYLFVYNILMAWQKAWHPCLCPVSFSGDEHIDSRLSALPSPL